ncbi:MAG: arsenate reductase (glutaredoxin) [Campylobacteraceae bacterium 4484_4]|nr:MAG: arsenate reductase (glutaredoxin) [Campylobacteraceae bacterium 4484_4]
MSDIKIWHNPRCSKSRDVMKFLEAEGLEPEVIKYLEVPHTKEEIKHLIEMLGLKSARELMRTKEPLYRELGLKEETDEEKLIEAMVEHPRLIERPIVIKENRAVIGRPIEKVIELVGA